MKRIILISTAVLILATGAVSASLYVEGYLDEYLPPEWRFELNEDELAEDDLEELEPEAELLPPIYVPLETFTVNFSHQGTLRYLQLNLSAMSRDEVVIEQLKLNMPVIRNDLIMLLSSQNYEGLITRSGKELVRKEIHEEINKIIGDEGVESVFITGFVMQ